MLSRAFSLAVWCLCLGMAPLLPSCTGGTETGNPPTQASLALGVWSSEPERVAAAPSTTPIVVDSLWLFVDRIEYETCTGDRTVGVLVEPTAMNLLASSSAQIGDALDGDDYCQVRIFLARAPAVLPGAPARLQNAAAFIAGSRSDGAPFEIYGHFSAQSDPATGAPLNAEATPHLMLGVDLGRLFAGIDVDGASAAPDGVVRLEFSDASAGQGPLVDALNTAFSLHFDANDNGRIDADEPDVALR